MSPYGEPRRPHLSLATPKERESSLRVLRCLAVDGKPTNSSNPNRSTLSSWANRGPSPLILSWSRIFFIPSHAALPQFRLSMRPGADQIKDAELRSRTSTTPRATLSRKTFSMRELLSAVNRTPLDKTEVPSYGCPQKGRPRRGDSVARPSGPVPGPLDQLGRRRGP